MKTYNSEYWRVELPDEWQAEQGEGAVMLYHPEQSGTVLISAIREDDQITDEYLADLLEEHVAANAELEDVELGQFDGINVCYESQGEYWCEWYLRADRTLLFVTYNCPLADEGSQDDLVESVLETLQLNTGQALH